MRLGATNAPLDGRALTHEVDARAGERAGSSAATLHGAAKKSALSKVLAEEDSRGKERG
jgi:hypothetical protein